MKINSLLAGVALMATSYTVCAQDNTVTVQTKKIGADIQPTMYGVFFEDINFGSRRRFVCRTRQKPFF